MANPTPSQSAAPSFLWDQIYSWGQAFNEAQKEMGEFERQQQNATFENIWSWGEKLDNLGFRGAGKAAACALDPARCLAKGAPKIPSALGYYVPKMAFETTLSAAKWTGRGVYYLGSSAVNAVKPDYINITTPRFVEDLYNGAAKTATHLSDEATSWITGQPTCVPTTGPAIPLEEFWQPNTTPLDGNFTNRTSWADRIVEPITSECNSTFQATELIGHTLFLSFFSNRCSKNLSEAIHHAKLLVTGQRIVSTSYTIPTVNSRVPTTISKTKIYTTPTLLKDIVMELGFAALWGAGAYYTYEGLYDRVLEAAGGNAVHALTVVRTIAFASGAAPLAYSWIKEALYAPASSDTSDQRTEEPTQRSSTTPPGGSSLNFSLIDEKMSFEDAMEILGTRSPN